MTRTVIRLCYRLLCLYWRVTRPLVLGVCAVLVNDKREVLLVKHSYLPGWYFPGGGVKRGESTAEGVVRELREETGIEALSEPRLIAGPTYRVLEGKHDHVVFYAIDDWTLADSSQRSLEIEAWRFFPLNNLPADVSSRVQAVLEELSLLNVSEK